LVQSLPARAPLHAWTGPEVAREARQHAGFLSDPSRFPDLQALILRAPRLRRRSVPLPASTKMQHRPIKGRLCGCGDSFRARAGLGFPSLEPKAIRSGRRGAMTFQIVSRSSTATRRVARPRWNIVEAALRLAKELFDPYRPERHYMRGPGPKWRA